MYPKKMFAVFYHCQTREAVEAMNDFGERSMRYERRLRWGRMNRGEWKEEGNVREAGAILLWDFGLRPNKTCEVLIDYC